VAEKTAFNLYDDQKSRQNSLDAGHRGYLMFFKDSVRGLQPDAPLEFRSMRLGTVSNVQVLESTMSQGFN
ncbi:intermembrane transport protein PqiB, partial [Salmonella enterica]